MKTRIDERESMRWLDLGAVRGTAFEKLKKEEVGVVAKRID